MRVLVQDNETGIGNDTYILYRCDLVIGRTLGEDELITISIRCLLLEGWCRAIDDVGVHVCANRAVTKQPVRRRVDAEKKQAQSHAEAQRSQRRKKICHRQDTKSTKRRGPRDKWMR